MNIECRQRRSPARCIDSTLIYSQFRDINHIINLRPWQTWESTSRDWATLLFLIEAENLEKRSKLLRGPDVGRTLGGVVETYKEIRYLPTGPFEVGQGYSRALQNLFLLLSMLRPEASGLRTSSTDDAFLASLISIQRHALELLDEWWSGRTGEILMETWIKPCMVLLAVAAWAAPEDTFPEREDENGPRDCALEVLAPTANKGLIHLMRHVVYGPTEAVCLPRRACHRSSAAEVKEGAPQAVENT